MSVKHPVELLLSDGSLPQLYLPSPPSEPIPCNVRKYTLAILSMLGLKQYQFDWMPSSTTLGLCVKDSYIAISNEFFNHPNPRVWKTVLHEIAHALEYALYGQGGHGESWKRCCKAIGLNGKGVAASNGSVPYPSAELLLKTMLDTYYA